MPKAIHLRDNIDWLYVLRKEGRRKLESIEDYVEETIQGLKEYTQKNFERLITTASKSNNNMINRKAKMRKQKWEEKQLYGDFKLQSGKIIYEKTRI